ncbi:MAG TPA: hypothetical protein VGT44_03545 [Ktedonobacteraceae bacterium]|nr:hypothetical protein [Ktedonobacteraceae bacterium]
MQHIHTVSRPGFARLYRSPSITVARLTLESYLRSGWMWGEFVLVLVFFAALFFPFMENVAYFYGTSAWDLSAIAVLGAVVMVRQSTSARTYVVLARLTSRAAYSRGLILATAALRVPILLFFCALVLVAHRLTNPTPGTMVISALGLLPITILAATLTVTFTSPIGTRRKRMLLLIWIAVVLFSLSPLILLPQIVVGALSFSRIPLAPIAVCYNVSVNGSIDVNSLWGFPLIVTYIVGLAWLAGYWLEKKELLLY